MSLTSVVSPVLFVPPMPVQDIRSSTFPRRQRRSLPLTAIRSFKRNVYLVPNMCVPNADSGLGSTNPSGQSETARLEIKDDLESRQFRTWRLRIFYSIFVGYASFYLTRNSFTYVAPVMRQALGFSLEELGIVMSVFPLSYGFSKLVAGVLSDRFSARVFMAVGLALTGLINILFGFQTSLYAFVVLWIANGFFQAAGAPPCAKLLTVWYPQAERGTWWGFWNTSHNTGGFIIPLLAGYCSRVFGWQYGLIVPGVISIFVGIFLFDRLRDSPSSVGLPSVDKFPNEERSKSLSNPQELEGTLTPREKLIKFVINNPYVWLLATSYFFVYFVRQGISCWAHVFLIDFKGVKDAQEAAFRVSGMEIGGLLGSLVSGWASDKMMRGRRIPIIVLWLVGVIVAVCCLWFVPAGWRYLDWLIVFAIGFFIYGPQMLVGLAGAEIVDKSAVSSTIGLLGWIAYLGASVSGYPLTKIISRLGWGAYIVSLVSFSIMAILMLLPMWTLGMGDKTKPFPQVGVDRKSVDAVLEAKFITSAAKDDNVPTATTKYTTCKTCAGTGNVIRLECGPATPSQTLSCKYIETLCPWCGGSGYFKEA